MTTLTLTLQRKSLTVRVESGVYAQKLSFQALLAKEHSLCNHEGAEVCSGYVELVAQKPKYETEAIWFVDAVKDPDTGVIDPSSISFYALVAPELFALIRDSHPSLSYELRIHTQLLGALRFDDPLGFAIKWDTSLQNPVPAKSYELVLGVPTSNA
jgi:hypothetical protein